MPSDRPTPDCPSGPADPASDLASPLAAVLRVAPVHELPKRERLRLGIAVTRGRGRPKTITVPVADAGDYHRVLDEHRTQWIDGDPAVRALQDPRRDPSQLLGAVSLAIAQECAGLLWERRRAEKTGQGDVAALAHRRVDGLTKLAALQIARIKLGVDDPLDAGGDRLKTIVALFTRDVRGILDAVLPSEKADRLGREIADSLHVWMARGAPT